MLLPLLLQLTQVTVSRCYGRLYQDGQYKDLFHIPCCDPGQAFVFDLEHTGSGIYNERFREATLQTAFQYSTVVPASSSGVGRGESSSAQQQQQHHHGGDGPQYVVQRRLRVCTVRWVWPGSKEQLLLAGCHGRKQAKALVTAAVAPLTCVIRYLLCCLLRWLCCLAQAAGGDDSRAGVWQRRCRHCADSVDTQDNTSCEVTGV